MTNKTTEYIPISKLKLLERNPRRITKEQMTKLENSLKNDPEFLNCRPILVNDNNGTLEVYAGNQRVRAAKKLKWKEVPCIIEKDLDPEVMKARTIKDNFHAGTFDYDLLSCDYDIDMLLDCGFTTEQLEIDVDIIDIEEKNKESKESKGKSCPHCGGII
jgi:ParB-like chromosome segregation protein Spo0J